MTFAELKAELLARGFDFLSSTRQGQYINAAMHELEETELWPFREASALGETPLAIEDLGTIEMVINTSNGNLQLEPAEWSELVGMYGDLSIDGTPVFYYVAWPSASPTVATYPESADTIAVQYWAVSDDLELSSDTPLVPARFHKIIVDMAVREAYRDSDNHAAAEGLQGQIERDLARMRQSLFSAQMQGPGFVRIVAGSEDY